MFEINFFTTWYNFRYLIVIIFCFSSFSIFSAVIETRDGYTVTGKLENETKQEYLISVNKIEVNRSQIIELKYQTEKNTNLEFFGKLIFKDRMKIVSFLTSEKNGDIIVKSHPILGNNIRVKKDEIFDIEFIGIATLLLQNGILLNGYIIAEKDGKLFLQGTPGQQICIDKNRILKADIEKKTENPQLKPENFQSYQHHLAFLISFQKILGDFSDYLPWGTSYALEYQRGKLPPFLLLLDFFLLKTEFFNYSNSVFNSYLSIQYLTVVAATQFKLIHFAGGNCYLKTGLGIAWEKIQFKNLNRSTSVIHTDFALGYSFRYLQLSFLAELQAVYSYDKTAPLGSFGLGIGVSYGF